MSQTLYRRKAILSRIHKALDAFYMLQKIDWEYDIRSTLERILALALEEIDFEGGKRVERALMIIQMTQDQLEIKAGYSATTEAEKLDLSFSRTVVENTIEHGEPILCENAKDDPRFMEAESIKSLHTLSLISVPLQIERKTIGAMYVETKAPGQLFETDDLEFLREFAETTTPYLKTALTHQDHVEEIRKLQEEVRGRYNLDNIIGRSESIQSVFDLIKIACDVDRTVLITGESGCGKELVSRAIHHNGTRREKNFVIVDCSGLSEHLLESELFGHKKGAFTGASGDKIGAFEAADGGTLFLDEISDAPKALQQKLRRVLQEGEIRRVGETTVRKVDVRVICATNKNLGEMVREGEFIRDLYYRVNKFPIHIPPLRERREDIPLLVHHFLEMGREKGTIASQGLTTDAMARLVSYDWAENNIRELRNTVELAADFARDERIDGELLDRVLKIQESAAAERPSPSVPERPAHPMTLVQLNRGRVRDIIASYRDREDGDEKGEKSETPFYRLQLELSGRLIVEGLRSTDWKLRPASKILGISPMKLRGELKEFLRREIEAAGGNIEEAAEQLDIPEETLRKKAADLGIDS
ncbi:MAG: sigma 54-interacting transcriptional regulator [Planctomycetota bacterium]